MRQTSTQQRHLDDDWRWRHLARLGSMRTSRPTLRRRASHRKVRSSTPHQSTNSKSFPQERSSAPLSLPRRRCQSLRRNESLLQNATLQRTRHPRTRALHHPHAPIHTLQPLAVKTPALILPLQSQFSLQGVDQQYISAARCPRSRLRGRRPAHLVTLKERGFLPGVEFSSMIWRSFIRFFKPVVNCSGISNRHLQRP